MALAVTGGDLDRLLSMSTVELSFWTGYIRALGGDHRTQLQVATLSSMVSGLAMKKPLSVKRLMPNYPWGARRRLSKKARRRNIRGMALTIAREGAAA